MGGLNATEILASEMTKAGRLDAEFVVNEHIAWLRDIQTKREFIPLAKVVGRIGSGHTPYKHDISQGDVGFITVECVGPLYFAEEKLKRITREQYDDEFETTRAVKGGVLCTIKRRICQAYPFLDEPSQPLAINQDVALLIPNKGLRPAYLATYLSCKVGQRFADRQKTEQMNPYISGANLRTLPITILTDDFQSRIEDVIKRAYRLFAQSRKRIQDVDDILFGSLGLEEWTGEDSSTFVRKASEVFRAGRADADYFRPRYQSLMKLLRRQGKMLRDVARLRETVFTPQASHPFNYIEIGDLAADGAATSNVVPGEEAPSRATWIVQPGDVITSTVRPIRCLTGLIEPEQAGNICSSGFAVLTPKGIPSELLFAYLRLPVICELMDLHTTASMYPAISTTDLMRLPFLLPDDATIKKVKSKITTARNARREAHALLENAKQAVEIAIEINEAAALAYLKKNGV